MGGAGSYPSFRGATEGSEPGIHNHDRGLWIPGLRQAAHPGMTGSQIQRLVAPENAFLVERDAALTRQIRLDVRPLRDAVAQFDQARYFALECLHALREGIAQPFHYLEQREIGVSHPAPGDVGAAVSLQQVLEIAEILRHALLPEFVRSFFRRCTLVLVIQRGPE